MRICDLIQFKSSTTKDVRFVDKRKRFSQFRFAKVSNVQSFKVFVEIDEKENLKIRFAFKRFQRTSKVSKMKIDNLRESNFRFPFFQLSSPHP